MIAMILAAGRGERLRPFSDYFPKPLIPIKGLPLIAYHLLALAAHGFKEVIINVSYLAAQIQAQLGDGQQYGLKIYYSLEAEALETGGGIRQVLPLLGNEPFLVVNGDIWTDYLFTELAQPAGLAHLVLADNPAHNTLGDFALQGQQVVLVGEPSLTFTGIGIYRPQLFDAYPPGKLRLGNVLREAVSAGQVTGEHYHGVWRDIGSLGRLAELA